MRALVVGAGRAGTRHAQILREIGIEVEVLSRRIKGSLFKEYSSGRLEVKDFDRVVIATETSHHEEFLARTDLSNFSGRLLIEKPGILSQKTIAKTSKIDARVAYNLRFLDALQWLKSDLEGKDVLRVSAIAHSYLPAWREDSGERTYYSQMAELGGGALNDLAHEFDYLRYLIDRWQVLASLGGRLGRVTINADDSWFVLGQSSSAAHVSVSLSLLSRLEVRDVSVDTDSDSYRVNLKTGTFTKNDKTKTGNQILDTYEFMLRDFTYGTNELLPSVMDNQQTLSLIQQVRARDISQNGVHQ